MPSIIKKRSFVIETRLPVSFRNKQVIDDNLGPITVPDGETTYEYQWFAGVGNHPEAQKKGLVIPMNIFTPYTFQIMLMPSKEAATEIWLKILGGDASMQVIEYSKCHYKEGRQIMVPITTEEIQAKNDLIK